MYLLLLELDGVIGREFEDVIQGKTPIHASRKILFYARPNIHAFLRKATKAGYKLGIFTSMNTRFSKCVADNLGAEDSNKCFPSALLTGKSQGKSTDQLACHGIEGLKSDSKVFRKFGLEKTIILQVESRHFKDAESNMLYVPKLTVEDIRANNRGTLNDVEEILMDMVQSGSKTVADYLSSRNAESDGGKAQSEGDCTILSTDLEDPPRKVTDWHLESQSSTNPEDAKTKTGDSDEDGENVDESNERGVSRQHSDVAATGEETRKDTIVELAKRLEEIFLQEPSRHSVELVKDVAARLHDIAEKGQVETCTHVTSTLSKK